MINNGICCLIETWGKARPGVYVDDRDTARRSDDDIRAEDVQVKDEGNLGHRPLDQSHVSTRRYWRMTTEERSRFYAVALNGRTFQMRLYHDAIKSAIPECC